MTKSFREFIQTEGAYVDVNDLPDCRDWFTKFCDAVKLIDASKPKPSLDHYVIYLLNSGLSPEDAATKYIKEPHARPVSYPDHHDPADVLIKHAPVVSHKPPVPAKKK